MNCIIVMLYSFFGQHTHTQPFYGSMDSVWDNPGEPVPEETSTHSHLSVSSHVFLLELAVLLYSVVLMNMLSLLFY